MYAWVSFLLDSPSAPFLPEYVKYFWIKLKIWCSFTLRTLLGISLQIQSSVKSLNDFSSRWHLIAALKHPTERLPNWVFFWLMTQNHKQNEVYILFLQLKVLSFHIDQIANICWITEKTREFQKNIDFCFIDYAKPLTMWIIKNCGKFLEMGIPDHLTCLLYADLEATVRTGHGNTDWFQIGKGVCQGCM